MSEFKKDENGLEMYLWEGEWKYRSCTSCGKDGHTYLSCEKHPFYDAVCDFFGVPKIMNITPKPNQQNGD